MMNLKTAGLTGTASLRAPGAYAALRQDSYASAPDVANRCAITGREQPEAMLVRMGDLLPSLAERIRHDHPGLSDDARISNSEADHYRVLVAEEMLLAEHGELTELDREVTESLARHDTIAENVEESFIDQRSFGERLSDGLASFGGSWIFIIGFTAVLAAWTGANLLLGVERAFDPYPFIFLNLLLSCIAALQAPVIMMSQKRTEEKDRLRSENDYRVNLKAELEIRHLHEKIDHLISRQWQRLAEIQRLQLDSLRQNRRIAEAELAVPSLAGSATDQTAP